MASKNQVTDNGQLFLAAYSEGNYVTMAAHRAIHQTGGELKAQLQAAVPGAGPYDVSATLHGLLDLLRERNPKLAKLFDPKNLSRAPEVVRNEIRRFLVKQLMSDDANVSYQPLFLDRFAADDQTALAAEHSVHLGWAPTVSVYLFHGRGDETVPYAASTSALDALQKTGATDISLTDDHGHLACVPEYFRFTLDKLDTSRKILKEPHAKSAHLVSCVALVTVDTATDASRKSNG